MFLCLLLWFYRAWVTLWWPHQDELLQITSLKNNLWCYRRRKSVDFDQEIQASGSTQPHGKEKGISSQMMPMVRVQQLNHSSRLVNPAVKSLKQTDWPHCIVFVLFVYLHLELHVCVLKIAALYSVFWYYGAITAGSGSTIVWSRWGQPHRNDRKIRNWAQCNRVNWNAED